jgi:hypothetical protein
MERLNLKVGGHLPYLWNGVGCDFNTQKATYRVQYSEALKDQYSGTKKRASWEPRILFDGVSLTVKQAAWSVKIDKNEFIRELNDGAYSIDGHRVGIDWDDWQDKIDAHNARRRAAKVSMSALDMLREVLKDVHITNIKRTRTERRIAQLTMSKEDFENYLKKRAKIKRRR